MERIDYIDKGNYEGYIWLSNNQEPRLLDGEEFECRLDALSNPFMVEAQLYNRAAHISYSVKYIDGSYFAFRFTEVVPGMSSTDTSVEIEHTSYCANRMGNRKLVFLQYWRTRPDELCENMEVLQPAELVFVGFDKEGGK